MKDGLGNETRMQLGSEVELGGSLFRCVFIDAKNLRVTLQFLGALHGETQDTKPRPT